MPHLEYDDLSVRRSLAGAHDALHTSARETDRDAALALRRIGALDLPTYDAPLLARLTATDEHRAGAALDRLVDVSPPDGDRVRPLRAPRPGQGLRP